MDEIFDIFGFFIVVFICEMVGFNVFFGGKLEMDEIFDIDDIFDMDEEGLEDLDDDVVVRIVYFSEVEVNLMVGKNFF